MGDGTQPSIVRRTQVGDQVIPDAGLAGLGVGVGRVMLRSEERVLGEGGTAPTAFPASHIEVDGSAPSLCGG